jgi:hypothetical protein
VSVRVRDGVRDRVSVRVRVKYLDWAIKPTPERSPFLQTNTRVVSEDRIE